jgi:hypothetical protein
MSKDIYTIVVGAGISLIFFILEKAVENIPEEAAIVGCIVGGSILFFGVYKIVKSKTTKRESRIASVKEEMKRMGTGILLFLSDRESHNPLNIPSWHDPRWNSWNGERRHEEQIRYQQKVNEYERETMGLYEARFDGDVIYLVEEAIRLGYRDDELEKYYKHPTNRLGAETVGKLLNALAKYIGNDYESSGK